ncbi:hypothetical protein D8M04_18040 [Oceanobacillus piezotolerans]|uniref:Uncharacterized protein n=1 Tax=Oceanobacillus piezotolerans TaxID=2448030 RepID=A0A498D1Y8_9BACI|nr:hypothetical protein [Oceanobacillus piezotolerans]RLL41141.1 hypothetical protein D8M04_18040 [Oceanobacillus piezotolerans]
MTQYIYIASPMRLPEGSFGFNPISPEQPNVFRNELDFIHLYFENNYDRELKQRFNYSQHFSYKHQVGAYSNQIPLKNVLRKTQEEEKCLTLLYNYIEEAIQNSNIVEYFTSVNGQEDLPLSRKRSINWLDIKNPYDLVLEDRELLEITFWN